MFIDARVAITYSGIKQFDDAGQGRALQPLVPPTPRIVRLAGNDAPPGGPSAEAGPGLWAGREVRQVARAYCEEFQQREALRRHVLTGARMALVQEFGSDQALSVALGEQQCLTALRVLFTPPDASRDELVDGLQQVSAVLSRYELEAQALWESVRGKGPEGGAARIRGANALYKASFGAIHAALRDEGLLLHALGKGRAACHGDTLELLPAVRATVIAQAMRYCEASMQEAAGGADPATWALSASQIEEAVQAALVRQGLLPLSD